MITVCDPCFPMILFKAAAPHLKNALRQHTVALGELHSADHQAAVTARMRGIGLNVEGGVKCAVLAVEQRVFLSFLCVSPTTCGGICVL